MTKRTKHTVLVQVVTTGSGGWADILYGHNSLIEGFTSGDSLKSRYFERYPVGAVLVATVVLSGRRRLTQNVRPEEGIDTVEAFKESYEDILKIQSEAYMSLHGTDPGYGSSKPSKPVTTTDVSDMFNEALEDERVVETPKARPSVDWATQIYVDELDREVLGSLRKLASKRHVATMMIGPSGYGKTSIPQQMAKEWGMDFLRWDCANVRDPEEFFGFRGARDGSTLDDNGQTIFTPSEFTRAVREGNTVIVLDELNRIDPYISNILFPLLDHAGRTALVGQEIVVGPNVMFFATINLGYQFTGTFTLDAALVNRFTAKIKVGPLPMEIEKQILMARGGITATEASSIIRTMDGLRRLNEKGELSVDASTRVSIQLAELVGCGLTLRKAVAYVIINGVSEEEAKLIADRLGVSS